MKEKWHIGLDGIKTIEFDSIELANKYIIEKGLYFEKDSRFNQKDLNSINLRISAIRNIEENFNNITINQSLIREIGIKNSNLHFTKSDPSKKREGSACHIAKSHAEQFVDINVINILKIILVNSINRELKYEITKRKLHRITITNEVVLRGKMREFRIILDIEDGKLNLVDMFYKTIKKKT